MGIASAKPKKAGKPLPPEIVAKFDKDGDGKLNPEERKAAQAEIKANKPKKPKAPKAPE
jgi:hypothetical protein